jgi:hypothetical protein
MAKATARTASRSTNLTAGSAWSISPEVRAEIIGRVESARLSGGKARFEMAQATGLVVEHGAIGTGRLYPTQGDYAHALGVSPSNVTALKRLAVLIGKGLTYDPAKGSAWNLLSSEVNTSEVVAVLEQKNPTVAKATGAAKAAVKAKAAKAAAKAGKAPKAKAPASTPKGEPKVTTGSVVDATSAIRKAIPTMDADTVATLLSSLTHLMTEAKARQASLKATPKAPVKVPA